jgi:hypothetical protein
MSNDYSYRLLQQEVKRLRAIAQEKQKVIIASITDIATIADNCSIINDMDLQKVVQNLKDVLE